MIYGDGGAPFTDEERDLLRRDLAARSKSRLRSGVALDERQIRWGFSYIDRQYGTRRSRAKRHLHRAWSELRAAFAEFL